MLAIRTSYLAWQVHRRRLLAHEREIRASRYNRERVPARPATACSPRSEQRRDVLLLSYGRGLIETISQDEQVFATGPEGVVHSARASERSLHPSGSRVP
jgi:hypothetical protein